MADILLVLPIVLPLLAAIFCIFAWHHLAAQRALALAGSVGLLLTGLTLIAVVGAEGVLVTSMGAWPAPFGIVLAADLLSAIMVTLAGLIGAAVILYSASGVDEARQHFGYYPLVLVLLTGVSGAFVTGDLFNLYVWFEVFLIASFVLMTLGGTRRQLEGGLKYFALNLFESALFLSGVGLLYGMTGTLNMADLAQRLPDVAEPGLIPAVAMLFLVAFGIKAAAFPFFFWLPASYHKPPVAVTTLFSGLMTKVGVYALIRVFTLIFPAGDDFSHTVILILGGLTMFVGVMGAVAQYDMRRLLSFHIISQVGYLLMGLGLFTVASLAGAIYFMMHVIIAKAALFLVGGIAARVTGLYDLKQLGGLYKGFPLLALLFLLPALSLSGMPPLSGFWAKLALISAALAEAQYAITGVALVVSVFTLFSMLKIWNEAFWKDSPHLDSGQIALNAAGLTGATRLNLFLPLLILAGLTVALGLLAGPLLELAWAAAAQLIDRGAYIEAVLQP